MRRQFKLGGVINLSSVVWAVDAVSVCRHPSFVFYYMYSAHSTNSIFLAFTVGVLHRFLLCSDAPSSGEGHAEDYCGSSGARMNDQSATSTTSRYICETEVSSKCPFGWAFYLDDGSEGYDSCLQLSTYVVTTWAQAAAGCPSGSHLLTVKGASSTSGLLPFAASLFNGGYFFIGCSQSASATSRGQGWSWVDSTDASNLNCGIGANGCALWKSGEPK